MKIYMIRGSSSPDCWKSWFGWTSKGWEKITISKRKI